MRSFHTHQREGIPLFVHSHPEDQAGHGHEGMIMEQTAASRRVIDRIGQRLAGEITPPEVVTVDDPRRQLHLAMYRYLHDPKFHARVQAAVQVIKLTHEDMDPDEDSVVITAAAVALSLLPAWAGI